YESAGRKDNLSRQFRGLMKRAGVYRKGIGFYTLRHVFRTVADAARDPVAADLIMGHSDPSMAAHYRERVEDRRLVAVADPARGWLSGGGEAGGPEAPEAAPPEVEEPDTLPRPSEEAPALRLRLYVG